MKICAFIVTYNRLELLKKCYHALANQTRPLDELVIINNASTDGTKEWLETISGVTIIHQENIGGAGGFRNGFEYVFKHNYDWCLQFDDDCEPALDYLEKSLPFLEKGNLKVATGRFYDKGKGQHFAGRINGKWLSDTNMPDEVIETEDAGFPFLFVHRDIFSEIGFPYYFWFIYLDDQEWLWRIRKQYKLYVLPIYAGMHYSGRESKFINLGITKREIPTYGVWKTYYFFRNVIVFQRIKGAGKAFLFFRNLLKMCFIPFQTGSHGTRIKDAWRGIMDGLKMDINNLK